MFVNGNRSVELASTTWGERCISMQNKTNTYLYGLYSIFLLSEWENGFEKKRFGEKDGFSYEFEIESSKKSGRYLNSSIFPSFPPFCN